MANIKDLKDIDIYYDTPTEDFMKLAKADNFFHGRYNDGEFNSILTLKNINNEHHTNCDGHQYFKQLGVDTKQVLTEYRYRDNYIISGGRNYFWNYIEMFKEIYSENPDLKMNSGYFYYDVLMKPSYFEEFNDFLNQRKVVLIAPSHMRDLKLFKNFEIIEIPSKNCYLSMNSVNERIKTINTGTEKINYCFIAGMMSGIIIHKFSKTDNKNSYYDIGSAWDYFFQSRKYTMIHHRLIFDRLIREYNSYYGRYIV